MKLRKLFAGVAAAATLLSGMALGAGSAMAADPAGSATITLSGATNAVKGHAYKVVKIGSYDYSSITKDGKVEGVHVATDAATAGAATTVLTQVSGNSNWNTGDYRSNPVGYVAAHSDMFASSTTEPWTGKLRDFVSSLVRQSDFQTVLMAAPKHVADSDTYTINGLADGLYIVIDTTAGNADGVDHKRTNSIPMLVATKINGHDFANQELGSIKVKNQPTDINKVIVKDNKDMTGTTEKVGDAVTFKLTSKVPLTVGYLNTVDKPYQFQMTDTMSKGLTFFSVTSVKIGDKTLTAATANAAADADHYKLTTTGKQKYNDAATESTATTLLFDLSNAVYAAGQNAASSKADAKAADTITIIYTAILNKDAIHAQNGANPNRVDLDYSHNPADNSKHHVPGPEVKVYTYDFGFTKVKADGQTSLDGAKFTIKKENGQYLKFNKVSGLWENGTADDKFTGVDGKFEFNGLGEGTYDIEETDVPVGYLSTTKAKFQVVITATNKDTNNNVLDNAYTVKFMNGNSGFNMLTNLKADNTADNGGAKVKNITSITQLPLTGATGIAIFGVMAVMVIGAGLAIGAKRRSIANRLA